MRERDRCLLNYRPGPASIPNIREYMSQLEHYLLEKPLFIGSSSTEWDTEWSGTYTAVLATTGWEAVVGACLYASKYGSQSIRGTVEYNVWNALGI